MVLCEMSRHNSIPEDIKHDVLEEQYFVYCLIHLAYCMRGMKAMEDPMKQQALNKGLMQLLISYLERNGGLMRMRGISTS